MALVSTNVREAGELLKVGQLVAIPTETVYGLAANALDSKAVAAIFAAKDRPTFDPLIVHVKSLDSMSDYVTNIPEKARQLAEAFWPGPLTLLLPKKSIIPDLVTSGLPTVGLRVPHHPLTLELLQMLEFPLAAPSANPFGYISPTTAQHVQEQLGDKIPFILDGGECLVGIESTIVSFEQETPRILRLGGLRSEDIESMIGSVEFNLYSSSSPLAPGMLKSHYAPRKPLYLHSKKEMADRELDAEIGYLFFTKPRHVALHENCLVLAEQSIETLSNNGLTNSLFLQAAQNLFGYLRKLDASPVKEIWVEILPEIDLGRAINDRLRRAAVSREL
ncbi:L-threonylcarbamoyladenylate synthase [Persicitalea sp.]|uniref:L-threonylcarbamoyladenylate synthase n=1 Tax=Persicitalea sp. TaxID=3100273 RepID=UPI003594498E